jgi:hypothetical protein
MGIPQVNIVTKVTTVTKVRMETKLALTLPIWPLHLAETHVGHHVMCSLLSGFNENWSVSAKF